MFKNITGFLNIFKTNKKLMYAVNIFILLVVISFILKFDTSTYTDPTSQTIDTSKQIKPLQTTDEYVYNLEQRVESIIKEIEGIESVKVMIYTKNTPVLEPIYDENTTSETNIEIGSDGVKREIIRDTNQRQVKTGNNNQVAQKYYQYPEISGVLVVATYSGNKNINTILLNSVKTLLNIAINNIEIVLSN